jgi:hypothetical protein
VIVTMRERCIRELSARPCLASGEGTPVRQQLMERLREKTRQRVPDAERPAFRKRLDRELQQSLGILRS